MKFSILFLLVVFPCYSVSAEPLFGFNFIGDFFHSVNEVIGKGVEVLQNVVSDVVNGLTSTTTNIYNTIFGRKTPPTTSDSGGQNSSSPTNSSSEKEVKSDANTSTNDKSTESKESANSTDSADKQ